MDGTVRAHVALASKAEMRAAVENALAAQPAWAAVNPAAPRPRADEVHRAHRQEQRRTRGNPLRASTARRSPTPEAIFSAASKSWNSRSAFRIS